MTSDKFPSPEAALITGATFGALIMGGLNVQPVMVDGDYTPQVRMWLDEPFNHWVTLTVEVDE